MSRNPGATAATPSRTPGTDPLVFSSGRGEFRFPRTTSSRLARWALVAGSALLLAACGGGSTTGGGTANSPFVGRYDGATTVTVSARARSGTVTEPITLFVNRDGLVQVGDAQSTIYASGSLRADTVRIDGDAAALVDPDCSGTITLTGVFQAGDGSGAEFEGEWSSVNAFCFGVAGAVSGSLTASRSNTRARASRVFETSSPALRRVFRQAAD